MTTAGRLAMARHIEMKGIGELMPYERNARTHSEEQIDHIAASMINEFMTYTRCN